ncbi:MAG: hypothetical protein IKV69_00460 [Clostridia bacterium]|nr:hypothetical protein [Clostridia bacterium]
MINNLVKKRQITNQEAELQRIKITLQQNELALLRVLKNLEFQYENKYNNMWTIFKKKKTLKEYKALKAEFDASARVHSRQTRSAVQQKTKRFTATATKSFDGLVRVADTIGEIVPDVELKYENVLRDFKFSIATPQKTFESIITLETIQTNISGILQIIETCQVEVEKQEEAVRRNMYFSANMARKHIVKKTKTYEIEKE